MGGAESSLEGGEAEVRGAGQGEKGAATLVRLSLRLGLRLSSRLHINIRIRINPLSFGIGFQIQAFLQTSLLSHDPASDPSTPLQLTLPRISRKCPVLFFFYF